MHFHSACLKHFDKHLFSAQTFDAQAHKHQHISATLFNIADFFHMHMHL